MNRIFLLLLSVCLPMLLSAQGKLTAYYANVAFDDYKEGQLIVDTNDPLNRIVDHSQTKFKFEGDDTGEYYSHLILKSYVTVKEYDMSPLPVEMVQNDATFVSRDGYVVRIFSACANGHSFYSYNTDDGEFNLFYDAVQTAAHQEYYVLSGMIKTPYEPDYGFFFEEPLEVVDGNIKLYVDGSEIRYVSVDDPTYVRYRPYKMGFLEEAWTAPEGYEYGKSAYDDSGNLMVDPVSVIDIPTYLSIAYIGAEDALYIDGTLYYRQ